MPIKQKLGIQMFMFAGDEDLIQNLWKLPLVINKVERPLGHCHSLLKHYVISWRVTAFTWGLYELYYTQLTNGWISH